MAGLLLIRQALINDWDHPLLAYESQAAKRQLPFVDLWLPAIESAILRLKEHAPPHDCHRPIAPELYQDLGRALLHRLVAVGEQVLFERFNRLRTPGGMLLAHLGTRGDGSGPPVRQQYEAFILEHRREGLASLLEEFPVLGRFLGTVLHFWLEASVEMLQRVAADTAVLAQRFGIDPGDPLAGVSLGLGDPHRGGRSVAVLRFSPASGDKLLVYKPKDMRLDHAYQQALEELNRHSHMPPLRTLEIYAGDGYGYMEYVQHRLCDDSIQLNSFYHNAGRLTAVLYVLGCTDCHHENLIASGDQLLLIDTETLLEGDIPDHISEASGQDAPATPSELSRQFHRSVLRSGLLPSWVFLGESKRAMDISALGIAPPAREADSRPGWLGLNSDGMMPGRIERPVDLPTSIPVGVGQANPLADHLDRFSQGFQRQCHELLHRREAWLARGGLLERFEGLPRRIVVRNTRVYVILQRRQLQPQALRSSLQQALVLEQLSRAFLLATQRPRHWRIFEAEVRQMERLDIPFFVHTVNSRMLPLGEGLPPVADFIETSGLQACRDRLAALDAAMIDFQLQLIRGSINALVLTDHEGERSSETMLNPCAVNASPDSWREEARALLEQLLQLGIRGSAGELEWLGMELGPDGESFTFGPTGPSLYGGSIGIALLAARVGSQDQREQLIPAILRPLQTLVDNRNEAWRMRWWRDQGLGINGCGGILLALMQLDRLGCASQLIKPADLVTTLVDSLREEFLAADSQLDVIGGCSGLIGPLLAMGTPRASELAIRAGERLVETQHETGGWAVRRSNASMLLGFSHGCAGFAAALTRLHTASGNQRFLEAAARALVYERSHFDRERGNWPDFRQGKAKPLGFMTSWCHGAPGIALGRACLWGSPMWDDLAQEELVLALDTTAAHAMPRTDHLCCGSLGLAGLLRSLADGPWVSSDVYREKRSSWRSRATELVQQSLMRRRDHGNKLLCFGVNEGSLLLPGCFTGLSGMGLALVDQAEPSGLMPSLFSAGLLDR
jgi:type 2 lantibiotic biosynthesis protein LanM